MLSEIASYEEIRKFARAYLSIPIGQYFTIRLSREGLYVHYGCQEYFIPVYRVVSSLCKSKKAFKSLDEELRYCGFVESGEVLTRCDGVSVRVVEYSHNSGVVAYTVGTTLMGKVLDCRMVVHSVTVCNDFFKVRKDIGGELLGKYFLSVPVRGNVQNVLWSLLISGGGSFLPVELGISPRGFVRVSGKCGYYEEPISNLGERRLAWAM